MTEDQAHRRPCLYSIGHSNHDEQVSLDRLSRHGIQAMADVQTIKRNCTGCKSTTSTARTILAGDSTDALAVIAVRCNVDAEWPIMTVMTKDSRRQEPR